MSFVFPDVRPGEAVELAEAARGVQGAVAGDAGADPGHLLLDAGLVLDAPGHVRPGAVLLALGHVVPPEGAHHVARVARVRLAAVPGEPRAGHQLPLGPRLDWNCAGGWKEVERNRLGNLTSLN